MEIWISMVLIEVEKVMVVVIGCFEVMVEMLIGCDQDYVAQDARL
jgi:hypothetical protein